MTDERDESAPVDRRSVLRALGSGVGLSAAGVGGRLTGRTGDAGRASDAGRAMAERRDEFYARQATAGKGECFRPNQREIYGPTDVNAQTGNGGLSVAFNDAGTMTVFRWPHPSFYDQLKYFTTGRDEDGEIQVLPNEGAFLGLARDDGGGFETTWLREATVVEQYYASDRADTDAEYSDEVVTVYALGDQARAVVRDLVAADEDALVRHVRVVWQGPPDDRPAMRLIAYENCNLVVSKYPQYPVQDWCTEETNRDLARYRPDADAVVHEQSGVDASTGEQQSVAVAMGFRGASAGHQVGGDAYEPAAAPAGEAGPARDAYDDAAVLPLSGNDRYAGQTTGALTADLSFTGTVATETVVFASAGTPSGATAALDAVRGRSFGDVRAAKESWLTGLLDNAPLPDTDDETLLALCRRALVTLVTDAEATENRAVVASIATQAPYAEDWVRDGAFFNYVFGLVGLEEWAADRNRWYADVQQRADDPRPTHPNTPPGNWVMNYYGDGVAGGPIPYEIDETGYGIWTLWNHYEQTGDADYLADVYPAIRRAADFLVECRDTETDLHCPTWEDDRFQPQRPTIVGAALVWLGLKAAKQAARSPDSPGTEAAATRYETRQHEVGRAIDRNLYGDVAGDGTGTPGYGTRIGFPMAEVAWPVCFTPYTDPDTGELLPKPQVDDPLAHPRIESHLDTVWSSVEPAFEDGETLAREGPTTGQYEVKGLIPLAKARREHGPGTPGDVADGIDWLATEHATEGTHVMGEAWKVFDGEVRSIVSQPHAWEQVLVYLAALETYPPIQEFEERTCGSVLAALRER